MIKGLPRYCVYVLADPDTEEVFYVGETNNFERRKSQHLEGSDQLSGFKVKALMAEMKTPIVRVIQHCHSDEAALMAEISWINHFIDIGAPLLNSQNFDGANDRQYARRQMQASLGEITGGKYDKKGLRHVANGKTYHNHGQKYSTGNPVTQVKGPFSPYETERLRKMHAKKMQPPVIAKLLNRDVKDVRIELKRLS